MANTQRNPYINRLLMAACASMLLMAATAVAQKPVSDTPSYSEAFRPQFHFTPQRNWMNDPNGLVYFDGEYHLFYQYNPFGEKWGHMSWGHAVSRDLVHWEHLPLALAEENGVMIFSGSAVVDAKNSSGFGASGKPPLVAIYTGYRPDTHSQTQNIAYSTDRGRTWTKYRNNPVIDIHSTEFRDPKVFWHAQTSRWIMTVSMADEHKVRFYASPDLKQWTLLGDFGPAGATGGAWECPDLFELPVTGHPGEKKWVLIVNINPGGIAGGSGAQYFVGSFDGRRFTSADQGQWLDYGKDFYAVVTWSDVPPRDGRRLAMGWINNWDYGQEIPTSPWRSMQSIVRALQLKRDGEGLHLVQSPVVEMQRLRGTHYSLMNRVAAAGSLPVPIKGKTLEIIATFAPGSASEFGLKVHKGASEETLVGYDTAASALFVDRSRSGKVDFHPTFTGRRRGPLPVEQGRVKLHLFVDWSSVEVFGNDGRAAITEQIFPSRESDGLALYAVGGAARLISLDVWQLQAIWPTTRRAAR